MSDNMTEKYQQYYTKLLNGTLTDAIIKSISYQANIQLANEIIAEQEKTIQDLESSIKNTKKELDDAKVNRTNTENSKIVELEAQLKAQNTLVTRLQSDLNEANKLRSEYENVKHQASHVDTFRSELIKERENHKKTRNEYENKITELNTQIEYLQLTPAKRKKIDEEKRKQVEVVESSALPLEGLTKDGGSF